MAPPEPSAGLSFDKIDKRYGSLYALRRVSFEVAPGEMVVLAGRNGSGKTTLLRIAAQLARPTSGAVRFTSPEGSGGKPGLGYVGHSTMVYDELTAEENLLLFARLSGLPEPALRVTELLAEVDLEDRRDSLVRTFSRGMRQRMAIARALLGDPAILLLDEPATGLDPLGGAWLVGAIRRFRDLGRTMLLSLHGESEISSLATRAIRLEAGAIVADTRSGATFQSILAFADA